MDDDKDKNVIEKLVDKINDAVDNNHGIGRRATCNGARPREAGRTPLTYMPMAGDGFTSRPYDAAICGNSSSKEINFEERTKRAW